MLQRPCSVYDELGVTGVSMRSLCTEQSCKHMQPYLAFHGCIVNFMKEKDNHRGIIHWPPAWHRPSV